MSSATAIGFDFGATTIKTGVVRDGSILEKGKVIETRQDGNTDALVQEMIDEIQVLRTKHPETKAVGFGVPWYAKAHCFCLWMFRSQDLNLIDHFLDQSVGITILPGLDDLTFFQNRPISNHSGLDGRRAKIKSDSSGGTHKGVFRNAMIRSPSSVRSGSTICNSGSFAAIKEA